MGHGMMWWVEIWCGAWYDLGWRWGVGHGMMLGGDRVWDMV